MVQLLRPQLRERFDLVGFDPRGVANSTPAVRCNSDADNDRLRADAQVDYGPAGVEHIEKLTKEFVQRCVDKKGLDFLATVGAANVAKDLDALRAALGDAKLTYLGSSYGTRVGSEYAEAYPQNVRAMVLDGAVDPNADPIEATVRQTAGFQRAFNDYAADCAKSADCPLGTDPAKAVDIYRSMVDPLVQKPAPTGDGRGLSYGDAIVGTILTLYSPHGWRHLTEGLNELKAGRGDALLTLADLYMGRDAQGHYNNSIDVRMAVNCADQPPVNDRAKVVEADRRLREGAPFIGYGEFTGHALLGTCAFWPVPPTSTPQPISVQGAAAGAGGVDDPRPGGAVPGRRRSGPPTRWQAAAPSRAPSTPWCCRATPASTTSPRAIWSTSHCRRQTLDAESALRSRYEFDLAKGWCVAPEVARRCCLVELCTRPAPLTGSNNDHKTLEKWVQSSDKA